ncbi:hypothetical protein DDT91_00820 [Algoriphagus sp. AK58]|nr:hypothetical protein [Algoriphagus sp. AK58]
MSSAEENFENFSQSIVWREKKHFLLFDCIHELNIYNRFNRFESRKRSGDSPAFFNLNISIIFLSILNLPTSRFLGKWNNLTMHSLDDLTFLKGISIL